LRDPAHDGAESAARAAGLARVRASTYQSVSGAGAQGMEKLRATPSGEGNLAMDWDFDGEELWAWLGPRCASHPCARGVVRPASSISGRF